MDNRAKIVKIIKSKKIIRTADVVKELKISRQKAAQHLKALVVEGMLEKTGSTRASAYSLATGGLKRQAADKTHLIKSLKGLKEDQVYSELEIRLGLKKLPDNVQSIVFYAFSEMLNNAIDHSRAKNAQIDIQVDGSQIKFTIRDAGIGIFANVQKSFHLKNEFEAVEHILKGKQTTFPEQHSGQGIFFTSRIADVFRIKSHQIEITQDNEKDDLKMKDIKSIKGTEVFFQIKKRSKKILRELFSKYSNEDYEFDRTNVKVHLTAEKELLARSQAKRLLLGLDQYKVITLDFKKVKEIGQAFVDEVFRVFQQRYPEIQIVYVNANPAIEFMIQRGLK